MLSRRFIVHSSNINKFIHRAPLVKLHRGVGLFSSPMTRTLFSGNTSIEMTPTEEKICALLDGCTKHLSSEKGIQTSCRIAGGWVRDKLLGSQSNDIDIALSDMMGLAFAEHLANYAREEGVDVGTISKIAQNPDQSKHLETATFRVFGLDLDLVNLRSEEYAENSRIPTGVAFGTPLQDALRRDITINALFFNVHTRSVEDFTEKGLNDLRDGLIRTPLPPRETFIDDPLRVLRCIRFSSRFGFEVVPEVKDAAKDPLIQEALISKVARERAGEEFFKMMKGQNPLAAIQLMHELNLYRPIFGVLPEAILSTSSSPISEVDADTSLAAASIFNLFEHGEQDARIPKLHPSFSSALTSDPTCRSRMYMASVLTPFARITYTDQKKKAQPVVEAVLRESVKLGTQHHFLDGIPQLFAAAECLRNPQLSSPKYSVPSQRVGIGLALRDPLVHNPNTGSHWTSSFLFSLIQELVPHYDVSKRTLDVELSSKLVNQYNKFASKVEELGLAGVGDAKPLLNGREISSAMGASGGGPWLGKILNEVIKWQLENPDRSKDACVEWVKEEQKAGRLSAASSSEPPRKKSKAR